MGPQMLLQTLRMTCMTQKKAGQVFGKVNRLNGMWLNQKKVLGVNWKIST